MQKLLPRSEKDISKADFSICAMFLTFTRCCLKQEAEPGDLIIKPSIPVVLVLVDYLVFFSLIFFFKNLCFKMKYTDLEILGLKKTSLSVHYLWKKPTSILGFKVFYCTNTNVSINIKTTVFSLFLSSFTNSISLMSSLCKHNMHELLSYIVTQDHIN